MGAVEGSHASIFKPGPQTLGSGNCGQASGGFLKGSKAWQSFDPNQPTVYPWITREVDAMAVAGQGMGVELHGEHLQRYVWGWSGVLSW
jgi:hypothetical protein